MWTVFKAFLALGLTSFGGPVAHMAYFHQAFVVRKAWFSEAQFAQWLALSQLLPGPASSQLGFLIGYQRAGWPGAFAAFIGFTLPSAILMTLLAYGWFAYQQAWSGLIHALLIVAAAVVSQAVWSMSKQFCTDTRLRVLALLSALVMWWWPFIWTPLALLLVLALIGQWQVAGGTPPSAPVGLQRQPSRRAAWWLIMLPLALLAGLPMVADLAAPLALFDSLFRAGALVFGGGHVVLPYLTIELVEPGQISEDAFLSGYALAQTLPGPLFSFAAYLGALSLGWLGALLATLAIFLAGLMWIIGLLPFYQTLIQHRRVQPSLLVIQAGVVGFVLAALINPILPHALINWQSAVLLAVSLWLLLKYRLSVIWLILLNVIIYALLINHPF